MRCRADGVQRYKASSRLRAYAELAACKTLASTQKSAVAAQNARYHAHSRVPKQLQRYASRRGPFVLAGRGPHILAHI